jgi:hypothetical protein
MDLPSIDLPTQLPEDAASDESTVQNLRWDFCLRFQGRPWVTLPVFAPSVEEATEIMEAWLRKMNQTLVRMGFPAGSATGTAGACV